MLRVRSAALCAGAETLGEVRVHGNHTTPDADVLALAGLAVGGPVTDDDAARRRRTKLRQQRTVCRTSRCASAFGRSTNPSDILVILLVDEHPGVAADDLTPGPLKRFRSFGMWLPIVDYADGYGFTYGARVSFVDALGQGAAASRCRRRGAASGASASTVDRTFERGPFTRVEGGVRA